MPCWFPELAALFRGTTTQRHLQVRQFFRQFSDSSTIALKKLRDTLENGNYSHYGVSMTLDRVSVREMVHLVHAYVNYRKHPCLVNHTSLMSCLENFSAHINRLEDLEGADFLSAEI